MTIIEESVHIHGKYQFELKQVFPFSKKNRRYDHYNVDSYLFLPVSLHINEETYTRDMFYRNLKTYIRLRTPTYSLADLATFQEPLHRLLESVQGVTSKSTGSHWENYEYQLKLFCLIFKRSLRLAVHDLAADPMVKAKQVKGFIDQVVTILAAFRGLFVGEDGACVQGEAWALFQLADEFMSCRVELYSFKVLEHGVGFSETTPLAEKVLSIIKSEQLYRQTQGYPSKAQRGTTNESFLHRQSFLKKAVSNILHLQTRKKEDGIWLSHILLGLSAGLAMFFATAVAFYSQNKHGALSLPLFLALVLGYVFKDRMKVFLQDYFSRTLRHLFWDRKRTVYHSGESKIGRCREHMGFVQKSALPKMIRKIREVSCPGKRCEPEDVLCYRKQVRLATRRFRRIGKKYVTEGMLDITRLNIERFLHSMDAPQKPVYLIQDGCPVQQMGDRVYHLNVVQHYYSKDGEFFRHFRIVLSHSGIKRIEVVADV